MTDAMEMFSNCVLTSRVLAKFLGYLNFFPYKCNEKRSDNLAGDYQQLRSITSPALDVNQLLQTSLESGRCVLLIPWLVHYMSHIDIYSVRLPYYQQLLMSLHEYFLGLKSQLVSAPNLAATLLQYVALSWLFNLSQFEDVDLKAKTISVKYREAVLDSSPIPNIRLVYECSDMLRSAKNLLIEYIMGMRSKVNVSRKITPLTAESSTERNTLTYPAPTIQQSLEENFFHNQPTSLKKSVGFIAERVSSSYIKEFRANRLASSLLEQRLSLYDLAKNISLVSEVKSLLSPIIEVKAKHLVDTLHDLALNGVEEYMHERVANILQLLLPSDTESYIITICNRVILQQGMNRVSKWLSTNLTLQYIRAELSQEISKYCRASGTCPPPNSIATDTFINLGFKHDEAAPSPSRTLHRLQILCREVIENSGSKLDSIDIETMLNEVVSCVYGRCDIEYIAMKSLCFLLTILLVNLSTFYINKITPNILSSYDKLWKIDGLQSIWDGLAQLVADIPGVDKSVNLSVRFYEYILYQQGLVTIELS